MGTGVTNKKLSVQRVETKSKPAGDGTFDYLLQALMSATNNWQDSGAIKWINTYMIDHST